MDLRESTVKELLQLHSSILDELKRRRIVRTSNNPVGDYTEWLVAKALGLQLAANSSAGYDGIDSQDQKFQIKGRRLTSKNRSRQLSAIRKLKEEDFDQLAAVIFNEYYDVIEAVLIPHEVIGEYASYRSHVNAHILHLRGPILDDPRIRDIKKQLAEALNGNARS